MTTDTTPPDTLRQAAQNRQALFRWLAMRLTGPAYEQMRPEEQALLRQTAAQEFWQLAGMQ